jgi:hypothetical protein
MLFKNYSTFPRSRIVSLFAPLEGVIQDMIEKGHRKFIRERFLLLKFMVDKNLYSIDEKYIHPRLVINVIINSLWNKEYTWLASFISNHKEEFTEYYRLALANLGMAYLKYFELKYDEALVLLSNINKHNFDILYRISLLRICIYIDTKEYDAAFNSLDSFRHFARTHKNVTERIMNDLLKICNNLDALARYKSGDKKIDLKLLRKTMMKDSPMFTNDLILEKVNEIGVEEKGK